LCSLKLSKMDYTFLKIRFYLYTCFFIVLCQVTTINSQNLELQTVRNKPPDFQNNQRNNQQHGFVSANANSAPNNIDLSDPDSDQRPVRFRCRNSLPLFAVRRNIFPQSGSSPYEIFVYPTATVPGETVYGK